MFFKNSEALRRCDFSTVPHQIETLVSDANFQLSHESFWHLRKNRDFYMNGRFFVSHDAFGNLIILIAEYARVRMVEHKGVVSQDSVAIYFYSDSLLKEMAKLSRDAFLKCFPKLGKIRVGKPVQFS